MGSARVGAGRRLLHGSVYDDVDFIAFYSIGLRHSHFCEPRRGQFNLEAPGPHSNISSIALLTPDATVGRVHQIGDHESDFADCSVSARELGILVRNCVDCLAGDGAHTV